MLPLDHSAAANTVAVALAETDSELVAVREHLRQLDPQGERFARVLRDTIDQLLNGEATGATTGIHFPRRKRRTLDQSLRSICSASSISPTATSRTTG